MKTQIISLFSGTTHLRSLSIAMAIWLGLSGVFPAEAAPEQTGDATDLVRKFFVGGVPEGVLFDGTYIWVTDAICNTVSKVRPSDGTVLGTFPTMGVEPRYLAFDGENIWVTHYGEFGVVSKLRASDGAFLGSFYGGEYPTGIVYAEGNIWVAAALCCSVILRASDGQQVGGFGEYGSVGLTFDGENVWVTSIDFDNVLKYRASDATLLGTFDVGAQPVGVAFDGENVWVANSGDGTVTKLLASDGGNLGTFWSGGLYPEWIAVDDAGTVWVTHLFTTVSALRASDGSLEKKHSFLYPSNITFDGSHIWISSEYGSIFKVSPDSRTSYREETFQIGAATALTFDGANIWVTQNGPGTVTELRASDGTVVGVFPAGDSASTGITFDGTYIWVVNSFNDAVTRLLQSDGSMQGTFPVGDLPQGILFDGANIWVTNGEGNTVTKLRASDGVLLGTFRVGLFPEGIAFDGENIWVANFSDNTVTKLRASDGAHQGTFSVGDAPYDIVFDGTYIWVSNNGSDTVMKLQPSDGSILDTGVVAHEPKGLAVDGTHLFVACYQGETVEQLGLNNADFQQNFGLIDYPEAVLFDGTSIWVTRLLGGVSKITPKAP